MILLERLLIHQIGAVQDADLRFAAKGTHILHASVEEALGVREALRFALFGDPSLPSEPRPGGYAVVSIVVGGVTYTIERQLNRDQMTITKLNRAGRNGMVQINNTSRIDRELDRIIGPNTTAFESLIWPIGYLEETTKRLPEVMRAWLGSRRMHLLEAKVETSQDMKETERIAELHVKLAEAAQDHLETTGAVADLDLALKRNHVWRAIQHVEKAERLINSSRQTHNTMEILAARFSEQLANAACALEVMQLYGQRDAAISRVKSAQSRQLGHEQKLSELAQLKPNLSELEHKLDALGRLLATFKRIDKSAAAAKEARIQIASIGKEFASLETTRRDLAIARRRIDRLSADATRAQTLTGRVHEEAHLPNATNLWNLWAKAAAGINDLKTIEEQATAHQDELNKLALNIRGHDRINQARTQQRRISAAGTVAGTALAVAGLGLTISTPLVPVGLFIGLLSATTGLWLNISQASLNTVGHRLIGRRSQLQYLLRQIEHGRKNRAEARQAKSQAVSGLREINMEVPTTVERATTLRDSAIARLRRLSLGDERRGSSDLEAAYSSAANAVTAAQNDVVRLEAREETLMERQIEDRRTSATAELKTQLEKSSEAQREADRLAIGLPLSNSRKAVQAAQLTTTRAIHRLRTTINTQAELELERQVSIRDQTQATSEVVRLEQMIGPRHMRLDYRTNGQGAQHDRSAIIAEFVASLAEFGTKRSVATAHAASIRERSARSAVQRHTTDLAASLRSLGVETRVDPTSAEARAAVPLPATQPENLRTIRTSLRHARATARKTEVRLQTLELRAGVSSTDIDREDVKRRLDELVHARRVREIGRIITTEALAKTISGIPSAVEHTYRATLPMVTNGQYWDVRINADFSAELWDSSRNTWVALSQLDDDQKLRSECALAISFASAAPPLDATDLPAFLWLEQNEDDQDGSMVTALGNAARQGESARRYPQLIMVLRSDIAAQPHFEHVTQVATTTSHPSFHANSLMREAG